MCQLEVPWECVAIALDHSRRHGAITVLNPAPVPAWPLDVLPLVDYLTPNAGEAERLSNVPVHGPSDAIQAAQVLRAAGARTVVVTLGGEGALACGEETVHVPAFAVPVVDTTGAGDAFNGGLAVALAERCSLRDALLFASAAAALTCTRRGAQASLPTRAEVVRLGGPP